MHCIVIATNVPSLGPFLKACNSRLWATGGTEQTQVTSARRASASTKGFHKLKDSEVNASEPGRVTEGSMFRHDFGFSGRAGEPGEGGSYEGTERRASDLAGSGGITKTTDWIISKQHEDEARRAPQGPATYVGCGVAF